MRTSIFLRLLTLSLLFASHAVSRAYASSGTRGGGNMHAAEFSLYAQQAIEEIDSRKPVVVLGFEFSPKRLQAAFSRAKIFVVEKNLKLDGKPVDAINDPELGEIYVNQKAWLQLGEENRIQLVLHELIGLTYAEKEISDLNYSYSSALLEILKQSPKEDSKASSSKKDGGPKYVKREFTCDHVLYKPGKNIRLTVFTNSVFEEAGRRVKGVHMHIITGAEKENTIGLGQYRQDEMSATFFSGHTYPNDPVETYNVVIFKTRPMTAKVFMDSTEEYSCQEF